VSEQTNQASYQVPQTEGTRFDAVVDHTIDLRASDMPYDARALAEARAAATKESEPVVSRVEISARKMANLYAVRLTAMRNEDKPFFREAA
jgi:hypothetical protein